MKSLYRIMCKLGISWQLTVLLVFSSWMAFSQAPSLINYQGIVRDDKGQPVVNQAISLRFEILAGSASGSVIYTDDQLSGLSTNDFGLFTTQIGKSAGLDQLDWQQNQSYYLRVSIDPAGGTNLVQIGSAHPFASVPFALHAKSVPVTYSNSVLSIGDKSFNISPTITPVPNTSITASGVGTVTSVGTNSFDINIAAPTFSNTGQAIITGTYPDFIVNTPTVPAAVTPSISVTNTNATIPSVQSAGSSFSINIPSPTFSNTSQNIITGSFPNFIVNTPTVPATPTVSGAGIVTVSAGPNHVVGVQSPTFTNVGQTIISGTYPNYSVNTPTVATPTIAVTSTAAAGPSVTSTGNSFNINVPPANFTNNGPTTISGVSPNFTVNSPAIVTYTNGTGISITSGSIITNTSPNITPTIAVSNTAAAGPSVTSAGSAFNINIPAAITPSMYASGIASVSPASGNSFTVSVAQPTFAYSQTNGSLTSGTSSANITPVLSFSNGVIRSGPSTNSFAINSGTNAMWSALGNIGTSTVTNFIGTTDPAELNFRVNNQRAGRIEILSNSLYFGYLAGPATNSLSGNTGLGHLSLNGLTSGFGNTGIGYLAGQLITGGIYNTAVGGASQMFNTTGSNNTSVGYQALRNNTNGGNNVVMGMSALGSNSSGSNNTILGHEAGYNSISGNGNVFLGFQSGYYETGNNKFYLSNSSTSVTPLVYGDFATGNLAIGTTNANAPLQFSNSVVNRKIVLWELTNDDHQYYGFGINNATLRYQTDSPGADHVFYAGTSSTTSNELFRIKGNGLIKMGTETGTSQGPLYPTGGGMMVRRIFTSDYTTVGSVVARTDQMTFERDGTVGGFRITNTGGDGNEVCNCTAINSSGVTVGRALNNLGLTTTAVYGNAENIVYLHCMFGDPYQAGHITEITLTRQYPDYFWVGTIMTTLNQ